MDIIREQMIKWREKDILPPNTKLIAHISGYSFGELMVNMTRANVYMHTPKIIDCLVDFGNICDNRVDGMKLSLAAAEQAHLDKKTIEDVNFRDTSANVSYNNISFDKTNIDNCYMIYLCRCNYLVICTYEFKCYKFISL